MTAALTFSPGQALMLAVIGLGFTLLIIWGFCESRHDQVEQDRKRQLRREIRRQP